MIVRDLIKRLERLPQEALVILNDSENGSFRVGDAVLTHDEFYTLHKSNKVEPDQEVVIINPEED